MHSPTSFSKTSPRLIFIEKCPKNIKEKKKPLGYLIKLYFKNTYKIDAQALGIYILKTIFLNRRIINHQSKLKL